MHSSRWGRVRGESQRHETWRGSHAAHWVEGGILRRDLIAPSVDPAWENAVYADVLVGEGDGLGVREGAEPALARRIPGGAGRRVMGAWDRMGEGGAQTQTQTQTQTDRQTQTQTQTQTPTQIQTQTRTQT